MSEVCKDEEGENCDQKKENHNLQVYENSIMLCWLKWKYWNVYSQVNHVDQQTIQLDLNGVFKIFRIYMQHSWLHSLKYFILEGTEAEFDLKNFNRVAEPPKTGSDWAPAQISKNLIQFQVEPTLLEPRLKFEMWLIFFKFGLCTNNSCKDGNAQFKTAPWKTLTVD